MKDKETWKQSTFSFPDVIYNRVASRKVETTDRWHSFKRFSSQQNTWFFNPHFFEKITVMNTLKENEQLAHHIPKTLKLKDIPQLRKFLKEHGSIYVKSSQGRKGNHLYKLNWIDESSLLTQSTNETTTDTYTSISKKLHLNETHYLMQKAILPDIRDGLRYDYRVLAHLVRSSHRITGIGMRASAENAVTTHVPRGGMILPYNAFSDSETEKVLAMIVEEIGKTLSEKFGDIGEFSVDIGRDQNGKLWIFEVNAKPMVFDELEIEQARVKELVHQAKRYSMLRQK
ncbi:YheC/YheD family protein [Mangrovibacillus cuniculi]|uniref:ATP-grasp domain-containing protein n=1 Tax=Mangrovibacillus cuniculi TaxID=2593652 RepID=A0A7S8C9M4_9BACI|nr:YheC/YheD family protein [Mangrovibacillus cuniculi]QPC45969.1 hypothetical protein G8O30_02845 [Mangrovibacillus cuniculi]